jgi:hypothetical protein
MNPNSQIESESDVRDLSSMSSLELAEADAYLDWMREEEDRALGLDRCATANESMNEYARNFGMDHPTHCWILDPRDVWMKNPYYTGPMQPHPEDEPPSLCDLFDWAVECALDWNFLAELDTMNGSIGA